jgi:hypothetical protein
MTASAIPMQNSRNSFWASDLKHLFDRAEINTKVKA